MQLHLQSMYLYTYNVNKSILLYLKTKDFFPFTVVIEECPNPIPTHALRRIKQLCILLLVVHLHSHCVQTVAQGSLVFIAKSNF